MNKIADKCLHAIYLNAIVLGTFRIIETILIIINFGIPKSLFQSEILGFGVDLIITNTILVFVAPLFYWIYGFSEKMAHRLFLCLITLLSVSHFLILKYFLYQLNPLDTFLFKYSVQEILFTVKTADISFLKSIFLIIAILSIIFIADQLLNRINFWNNKSRICWSIGLSSIAASLILFFSGIQMNQFSKNKALFFYGRTISYILQKEPTSNLSTNENFKKFQQLHPDKIFTNNDYPLLHQFKKINLLKPYFRKFDHAPNLVILIVEGLNDDFIRNYKGINLMPFTSQLKDESLYWNRCFTLGERSFAVVPSLLGSLPYGQEGFTLQNKLPLHLSLVSILSANHYQTNFFYGQGAWFHQKDQFFKYNDIDLILDNSKFDEKYQKIIVGNDNYFWGYNDKDLFNQSFEAKEKMEKKPCLDVYFTGTSHSPFVISDPDLYNAKFTKIRSELKNDSTIAFFDRYKKYIQSVQFVDDAIEAFFKKQKTLADYENTIFVITGDHPMTEIPIDNSIKRYHVPLIFYSPKLIKPEIFSHTVSHLDFYETILSFLSDYQIKVPNESAALGSNLILDQWNKEKRIAFMDDNREIIDFYSDNYFLSGDKLYSVDQNLELKPSSDQSVQKQMQEELSVFKKTNYEVCLQDKIMPDNVYFDALNYQMIQKSKTTSTPCEIKTEYSDITEKATMKNQTFLFLISFEALSVPDKDLCVVLQLSTKKDSSILWQSANIASNGKLFNAKFRIPKHAIRDTLVYFSSYFWNKNKKAFQYKNLSYSLYQKP